MFAPNSSVVIYNHDNVLKNEHIACLSLVNSTTLPYREIESVPVFSSHTRRNDRLRKWANFFYYWHSSVKPIIKTYQIGYSKHRRREIFSLINYLCFYRWIFRHDKSRNSSSSALTSVPILRNDWLSTYNQLSFTLFPLRDSKLIQCRATQWAEIANFGLREK